MPNHPISSPPDLARVRRIVLTVVLLVAISIAAAWLLYALRMVVLLLVFTVMFCYLIAPLVDFVERPWRFGSSNWKLPRSLAIAVVYLLLLGGIVLAADEVAPRLSDQLSAFSDNVPAYAQQLDQYVKSLEKLPNRYRLPQGWRQPLMDWMASTRQGAVEWLKAIVGRTVRLALFLPWLVLIPVIGFFFLKDAKAISIRFLSSLPESDLRHRLTFFLREVSETLAAYIRAQLMACAVVGVIEGAGLWLLGISYPLVFAIAATVLEFIPVVGPLALGIAATLVASFHSTESALTVAGGLIVFRIIHDYVIYPRLIGAGIEIHPVAVILAVICGAELGGVTGVFLSIPVVALLIVCWRHWRDLTNGRVAKMEKLPNDLVAIE
ncbi:MAG: AI-2E family transporter [Acidobacteriota bacterium]|nr:AI-2E family transporter [Acidobacteriota bacterium]